MNCRDARLLFNQFVDDELEPARSFEVDRHIEACPRCRTEVEEIRALDLRVRDSCRAGSETPCRLRARLAGALDGQMVAGSRRRRIFRWTLEGAGVAAGLLLAAVLIIGFSAGPASASFVTKHVRCRGMSPGDSALVEALCRNLAGAHAKVVCLERCGYKLTAVEDCRVENERYLHLFYDAPGKDRVSLFVGRRWLGLGGLFNSDEIAQVTEAHDVIRLRCPAGTEYVIVGDLGTCSPLCPVVEEQIAAR
jgi:hypothetical protein